MPAADNGPVVGLSPHIWTPRDADLAISPTLVIGLGGSGYSVVWWLRRMFYERYGQVRFPMVSHLVIDTDHLVPEKSLGWGRRERQLMAAQLRLSPNASPPEFVNCQLGRDGYRQYFDSPPEAHPHIFSWLDTTMDEFCFGDLTVVEGCGMQRPFGRLSFFHHFRDIERAIAGHLNRITQEAARDPRGRAWAPPGTKASTDPDRLEVIVVHSLAGGAGAGMFIDVCYLIRQILRRTYGQKRTHITDIAVLPGWLEDVLATSHPDQWTRVQANAYACLMEMEHLSMRRWDRYSFLAGGAVGDRDLSAKDDVFEAEWELGTVKVRENGAPWDTCYLIDNRNAATPSKLPQDEVFKMVAEYLMLDFEPGEFGEERRIRRSIDAATHLLRNYVEDVPDRLRPVSRFSHYCRFRSFGVAQVHFDLGRTRQALACRLAESLVSRQIGLRAAVVRAAREAEQDLSGGEVPYTLDALLRAVFQHEDGSIVDNARSEFVEELACTGMVEKRRSCLQAKPPPLQIIELCRLHEQELASPAGGAYVRMSCRAQELGDHLQRRLTDLSDQAFDRSGTASAIGLLDEYRKRLLSLGQEAHRLTTQSVLPEHCLTARLGELPRLWHRRSCALRIEFPRAVRRAWEERTRLCYLGVAGELICGLVQRWIAHIENRKEHYEAVRDMLQRMQEHLHKRFLDAVKSRPTERSVPLVMWTDPEHYDQALQRGLLDGGKQAEGDSAGASRSQEVDWQRIEGEVYRQIGKTTRFAECGDRLKASQRLVPGTDRPPDEAIVEFAEDFVWDCYAAVGEFPYRFNAVDALLSDAFPVEARADAFRVLRHGSDPYFPRDFALTARFMPAHHRRLILDGDDVAPAEQIVERLRELGTKLGDLLRGDEAKIVLCQELAGLPLCLYSRLDELARAYESVCIQHLHIDYQVTKLHLPAIDQFPCEIYRKVQSCAPDFLFATVLGGVEIHETWRDRRICEVGRHDVKPRWLFCLRCRRGTEFVWQPVAGRYDRALLEIAGREAWMQQLHDFCHGWFEDVNRKDGETRAREMVTVLVGLQMLQSRIQYEIDVTGTQGRVANPIYHCAEHYVRELCEHLRGFEEGRRYLSVYDDREPDRDRVKIDQAQASCFGHLHVQFPVPVVSTWVPPLSADPGERG